jgi:hypothetical protein
MNKITHQQAFATSRLHQTSKLKKRLLIEHHNFLIKTQSIAQQFCVATFY